MINRRQLIAATGLAAPALAMPAILRGSVPEGAVAETAQGKLRGAFENGVQVFRGVPYAGSVSGPERRFRPALAPESWAGVRDAMRNGPASPQPAGAHFGKDEVQSEDCLVLNIWTPACDGKRRPVMAYQHGGGFLVGSGGAPWQDGATLARDHDVVVVQSNHRLGLMGYLYLGDLLGPEFAGNQGLTDLVAALRWVNGNIAAFGGDPGNVMIFGESGGGGKVASLYAMPTAAPYFHKASIESPIGPGRTTQEQAAEIARKVVARLGLADPRAILTVPVADLVKAQVGSRPVTAPGTTQGSRPADGLPPIDFWPFIDGTILPEEPFLKSAPAVSASKPLIVGTCRDESVFFHRSDPTAFRLDEAGLQARLGEILGDRTSAWIKRFRQTRPGASPSELFIAITTARPWRAYAISIAEHKAVQRSAPVYSYILDYRSPEKVPGTDFAEGSPHASDIAMKFDTAPLFGPKDAARLATARNMSAMWAAFAHTGKPAIAGQPAWKPYDLQRRRTMIINQHCRLEADPEGGERAFFMQEPDAIRERGL